MTDDLQDSGFMACLRIVAANPEIVRQFDQMRGTNLQLLGSPIDLARNAVSGQMEADLHAFVEFVRDQVWQRLPEATRRGLGKEHG